MATTIQDLEHVCSCINWTIFIFDSILFVALIARVGKTIQIDGELVSVEVFISYILTQICSIFPTIIES